MSQLPTIRIKTYPHFDSALTLAEAIHLITDKSLVEAHAFHPFIEYSERWTKFAVKDQKGDTKSRPIKYASRRDSCIYSQYRQKLNFAYEQELTKRGIQDVALAYRRVPKCNAKGNKNNIDFANDAFRKIAGLGNCTVYTLDIRSFFESIDHKELKKRWMAIMGFSAMPKDHYCVFRNVTSYSTVDRYSLYKKLGYIGPKNVSGRLVEGYLTKRIPLQVCSGQCFRNRVVPLIKTNDADHGIPQGSPMSDVLANLYLIEFDTAVAAQIRQDGGHYFRYSDDILLIVPGVTEFPTQRLAWLEDKLKECGKKLQVQQAKSTVHRFTSGETQQGCAYVQGKVGKNGLEYLGFRFDGHKIYLRDSTRSRLQRKMAFAVNREVKRLAKRRPDLGRAELKKLFDVASVLELFYKVRDFEAVAKLPKEWTFWTYVLRAEKTFGDERSAISRQVRNFKRSVRHRAEKLIDKLVVQP